MPLEVKVLLSFFGIVGERNGRTMRGTTANPVMETKFKSCKKGPAPACQISTHSRCVPKMGEQEIVLMFKTQVIFKHVQIYFVKMHSI